jgi:FAD-dependent halogenase
MTSSDYDTIVVGGGPAGATAATLIAKAGHRVLLLEKEVFPRHQIGESLLPSTVHGIGRLLGVTEDLEKAGFPRKRGGTFLWGASPEPWTFEFAFSPRMAGPTSHAYQVERMRFDKILLDNARRCGAEVREGCEVRKVVTTGSRVHAVRHSDPAGRTREASARFVLDASGHASRIHSSAGNERRYSEFFRGVALYGYFLDGKRLPAPNSGNILCVAFPRGWFWYIPLSDRLTSVGAVVGREFAGRLQGDKEQALHSLITEAPMIAEYLAPARRVTEGPYAPLRVRKDYSYCGTSFWAPGLALIGDAACFIDPVFSSGVHLATYGALLAARSVNSVLDGRVPEERAFAEFEARYRREYAVFYRFLFSFYQLHADERSYFWQAKKITACPASELEAFAELVGGIASGEPHLTGNEVRDELARGAAELTTASRQSPLAAQEEPSPLLSAGVVADAMRESARLQEEALFGLTQAPGDGDGPDEALRTSADGLHWQPASGRNDEEMAVG